MSKCDDVQKSDVSLALRHPPRSFDEGLQVQRVVPVKDAVRGGAPSIACQTIPLDPKLAPGHDLELDHDESTHYKCDIRRGPLTTSASDINEIEVDANGESRRWSREPILVSEGSPQRLAKLIPTFERRPFTIAGSAASENKFLDLIVRMPMAPEETETPVATVSKRYKLVQHADVFEKACEALKKASIDSRQGLGRS